MASRRPPAPATAGGGTIAPAESALHYLPPVGEKEEYVARAMRNITRYLREGLVVV